MTKRDHGGESEPGVVSDRPDRGLAADASGAALRSAPAWRGGAAQGQRGAAVEPVAPGEDRPDAAGEQVALGEDGSGAAGGEPSVRVPLNEGETAVTLSTYQPRIAHKVRPLSQSQLNAIDLLILGHSDRSAANHVGVHHTTIGRWRQNHPAFRAELARRRQEVWGGAGEMFRWQLQAAVTELRKQLEDPNQDVRYRAARALLSLARWFAPPDEPVDVEGVLTLEARRLNVEKYELHPAQSLVYEDDRAEALRFLERRAGEPFTAEGAQTRPHSTSTEGGEGFSGDSLERL